MQIMVTNTRDGKEVKKAYALPEDVSMDVVDRFVQILSQHPDLNEWDILCRKDYFAVKLMGREDLASGLVEKGFLPSDANINILLQQSREQLASLGQCTDADWNIIDDLIDTQEDKLERARPSMDEMGRLLQSVVDFMGRDCVDAESAKEELYEMGFSFLQLKYFEFDFEDNGEEDSEDDTPTPTSFAETCDRDPEKEAYELLLSIARWFRSDCTSEEYARNELENEIGFPDYLIDAAWENRNP